MYGFLTVSPGTFSACASTMANNAPRKGVRTGLHLSFFQPAPAPRYGVHIHAVHTSRSVHTNHYRKGQRPPKHRQWCQSQRPRRRQWRPQCRWCKETKTKETTSVTDQDKAADKAKAKVKAKDKASRFADTEGKTTKTTNKSHESGGKKPVQLC